MQLLRRTVRGRPRHPDVLTPAEWRVLERLRKGESNAEIAAHLDVSVNTVRTHVSSMLAKLELRDRVQLARWDGDPAPATRAALQRGHRTFLAGPLGWLRDSFPALKPALAVGAVVVAGAAIVVGAFAASRWTDREQGEMAAAGVSELPEATPPTTGATAARFGSPIVIDGDFLVVVLPSIGSEQPPSAIERISLQGGAVRSRVTALDPRSFGSTAYFETWRNIHYPPGSAGTELLATVCVDRGETSCSSLDASVEHGARTLLVRSSDGGVNWERLAILDGPFIVQSWNRAGTGAILWRFPVSGGSDGLYTFLRWPSMARVSPPPVIQQLFLDRPPLFLPDGRLAWWGTGGLVAEDGNLVLDFATLGEAPRENLEASLSPEGGRLVLTWSSGTTSPPSWRWTLFEQDSLGRYTPLVTLAAPPKTVAVPYSWLDDNRVILPLSARAEDLGLAPGTRIGYTPAVLDFSSGTLSAVAGFDRSDLTARGNLVIWFEPR